MTLLRARCRAAAVALAAILCASAALADVPAKRRPARPRAAETKAAGGAEDAARPDAELYKEAQRAHATLNATKTRLAQRPEWEKVVLRYRRVVARYPQSAYCDNALLQVGDLYRAMARRFSRRAYDDDAVAAYRSLVAEYPSSRLGEKALFAIAEIARARDDRGALQAAVKEYLAHYPDAARAKDARAMLARRGREVEEAALPRPPKPGLARVFNLRFWSGASSTRVVIDVERQVPIRHDRIADPDRLWVDLDGTRLHPNLIDRSFPVGDGLLEKVRIAQNKDEVVRVVLDFKDVRDHTIFYLENPLRLVVDVRGTQLPRTASAARPPDPIEPPDLPPASPEPALAPAPSPTPDALPAPRRSAWTRHVPPSPAPSPAPADTPIAWPSPTPSPTPRPTRAADSRPRGRPCRAGLDAAPRGQPRGLLQPRPPARPRRAHHRHRRRARRARSRQHRARGAAGEGPRPRRRPAPGEARPRRAGGRGHPHPRQRRLHPPRGAHRHRELAGGRPLPLHPRQQRAQPRRPRHRDLLPELRPGRARGGAGRRENAVSAATMKDLQNLVKAITLNSKLDESRDFAASVQESMVGSLREVAPAIRDRGVRTAPLYVLIGANMPSVLAEISFVSNPADEKLLRTPEHRERIADSLFAGVRRYLESLNRAPARQLTGVRPGSTVVSKDAR